MLLWLLPGASGPRADTTWVEPGADGEPVVHLYFFWSLGCPHCVEAQVFVEAIPAARPWVRVHAFEISRHPANARLYAALADEAGQRAQYVPALLFCGTMEAGWAGAATSGQGLLAALDACRAARGSRATPGATSVPQPPALTLPLLGELSPGRYSLPVLTVLIAGLDAFNPCAFFVLLFLLSMLVHQKSRARMLAIGGVFVLVSGLMYFAFMAAWLNLFHLLGQLAWVTATAGGVALLIGLINVKDFLGLGRGVSLSIPESRKPAIYRRTRGILAAGSVPAMLAATVLLAIAVNFYELLCTAGFPMVYTRLLTLHEPGTSARYAYLALYNLVYVIPLAVIVTVFAFTLGARKLTEREGRLLKLLSGLMMLQLGMFLVFAPDVLNRLEVAFALTAIAAGLTWIAARVTRS